MPGERGSGIDTEIPVYKPIISAFVDYFYVVQNNGIIFRNAYREDNFKPVISAYYPLIIYSDVRFVNVERQISVISRCRVSFARRSVLNVDVPHALFDIAPLSAYRHP